MPFPYTFPFEFGVFRSASASMGLTGVTDRQFVGERSSSGVIGLVGTTNRLLQAFRSASASITIDPWLDGWSKRVKVILDHNDIDSALSDFPHLVYLSATSGHSGKDVSCVFDELGSDANQKKIAITKADGITQCYVEIEKWDDANEKAWLWVKVPSVASGADTELYLYYDSTHADNDANVGITNSAVAENVWDPDFLMVQHQAGDSSPIRDSTSNDIDMTEGGDPTYLQVGPIDGEIDYDGNDYHLSAINVFDAIVGTDKGTMSLWIKTTTSVAASHVLFSIEGAYVMLFRTGEGGLLKTFWSGTHSDSARTTTQINTGAQFYIVSTYDGTNQRVYVNGNLETTDACNLYDITALNRATGLASDWTGLGSIDANIDDVRVSKTDRSVSWIKASYESGRDHLNDFGSEETEVPIKAVRILHAFRDAPASFSMIGVSDRNWIGTRTASAVMGITGVPDRVLHSFRSVGANMGIVGTALRGWIGSRAASATMTVEGASARMLHSLRDASASMSQTATAIRSGVFTRAASGTVTIQGTATRVFDGIRSASASLDVSAIATGIKGVIRSASASMSIVGTAARSWIGTRPALAEFSLSGTPTRIVSIFRSASASIGLVGATDRVLHALRSAGATMDMVGTTDRVLHAVRSVGANMNVAGVAGRNWVGTRTSSATIAAVGIANRLLHSIRSTPASINQVGVAIRSVAYTRVASGAVVIQGVANRVVSNIRSAAATISSSAVSTRTLILERGASASMGLVAEGKRVYQGVRSAVASITIEGVASVFKRIIIDVGILRMLSKLYTIDLQGKVHIIDRFIKTGELELMDKIRTIRRFIKDRTVKLKNR